MERGERNERERDKEDHNRIRKLKYSLLLPENLAISHMFYIDIYRDHWSLIHCREAKKSFVRGVFKWHVITCIFNSYFHHN